MVFPQQLPLIPRALWASVSGPEKAGVGGSIPSLATTPNNPTFGFSRNRITY